MKQKSVGRGELSSLIHRIQDVQKGYTRITQKVCHSQGEGQSKVHFLTSPPTVTLPAFQSGFLKISHFSCILSFLQQECSTFSWQGQTKEQKYKRHSIKKKNLNLTLFHKYTQKVYLFNIYFPRKVICRADQSGGENGHS